MLKKIAALDRSPALKIVRLMVSLFSSHLSREQAGLAIEIFNQ